MQYSVSEDIQKVLMPFPQMLEEICSVIFRLGRYHGIKGPGLYWILPAGIDVRRRIDMRTMTVDIESQETVTKDSGVCEHAHTQSVVSPG